MEVMKMEYVYAAMLLHKAGKKVDEHGIKKILDAAGVNTDDAKIKSVVAALDGVDIDKAIKEAAFAAPAASAAPAAEAKHEKKEEKKEKHDEKKEEESAAAGLGALFG
jgi:large subunit ribosomal protein L12